MVVFRINLPLKHVARDVEGMTYFSIDDWGGSGEWHQMSDCLYSILNTGSMRPLILLVNNLSVTHTKSESQIDITWQYLPTKNRSEWSSMLVVFRQEYVRKYPRTICLCDRVKFGQNWFLQIPKRNYTDTLPFWGEIYNNKIIEKRP